MKASRRTERTLQVNLSTSGSHLSVITLCDTVLRIVNKERCEVHCHGVYDKENSRSVPSEISNPSLLIAVESCSTELQSTRWLIWIVGFALGARVA